MAETTYFCENCGTLVKSTDMSCTNCKKSFAGVRCPLCLYEGKLEEFLHGCPKCGYVEKKREPIIKKPKKTFKISYTTVAMICIIALFLVMLLYLMAI